MFAVCFLQAQPVGQLRLCPNSEAVLRLIVHMHGPTGWIILARSERRLHRLDLSEHGLICCVKVLVRLPTLQRLGHHQHAAGRPLGQARRAELL